MSLDNLGNKLLKEFKRSPGKSALLVAMIPVAIYCIAPLVIKTTPKAAPLAANPTSHGNMATAINNPAPLMTNTSSSKPDAPTWEMLVKWKDDDRLAKAVVLSKEDRNPFEFAISEKKEPEPASPPPQVVPVVEVKPALDVRKLTLELQGTLVGGKVRKATINGRTFREGQRINIDGTPLGAKEKAEPGTYLVLEEIQATAVTLTYGEQTIDLMLKPTNQLGAGQILTRHDAN